jgi:benzodiazapine receptor
MHKNSNQSFVQVKNVRYCKLFSEPGLQLFSIRAKNLFLAFLDCALVAITTLLMVIVTPKYSKTAAWLFVFVSYLLWTGFATYLTRSIYVLNS